MASESKALLEEHRKRKAPKTKAPPRKRHKQVKTTTPSHRQSSVLHTVNQGNQHCLATPVVEDDDEEDEPLINRVRLRRQAAMISTPPLSQDFLPRSEDLQHLQPPPQDLGHPSQEPQPYPPAPASSVSIWPELDLSQQEIEELDQLEQQMNMEGQAKKTSKSHAVGFDIMDYEAEVWKDQEPQQDQQQSIEAQKESQLQYQLLNALRT
ncbi:hypothetical protein BGZ74_005121, partial [Mortierella antarctica]